VIIGKPKGAFVHPKSFNSPLLESSTVVFPGKGEGTDEPVRRTGKRGIVPSAPRYAKRGVIIEKSRPKKKGECFRGGKFVFRGV